jgi:hypothetical protein
MRRELARFKKAQRRIRGQTRYHIWRLDYSASLVPRRCLCLLTQNGTQRHKQTTFVIYFCGFSTGFHGLAETRGAAQTSLEHSGAASSSVPSVFVTINMLHFLRTSQSSSSDLGHPMTLFYLSILHSGTTIRTTFGS